MRKPSERVGAGCPVLLHVPRRLPERRRLLLYFRRTGQPAPTRWHLRLYAQ